MALVVFVWVLFGCCFRVLVLVWLSVVMCLWVVLVVCLCEVVTVGLGFVLGGLCGFG